jgi:hypothetical protein
MQERHYSPLVGEALGEIMELAEELAQASMDAEFAERLRTLLEAASGDELLIRTFAEAGVLTYNAGLVVSGPTAEFQLTIVRSG